MLFTTVVDTPANTTKTSPLESWMGLSRGLIYRFQVFFPFGGAGLVGLKISEGGHQIYPTTPHEWLLGHGETIDFEDPYFITVLNTKARIESYNLDDLYDHKVFVRIGVVVNPDFIARFLPTMGYKDLQKIIEESTKEREAEEIAAALALAGQLPGEVE